MAINNSYEYINENSIHEDLLCSICTDPFEDPVSANQCGHVFCRKCITNTFCNTPRCPTCRHDLVLEDFHPVTLRPFLNQLNQLLVKCKSCSQINIQRGNFQDHMANCEKVILLCPAAHLKCDWKGQRHEMQDHVTICSLIKFQPAIDELNTVIKKQSEQIHCLYTILEKISSNHKKACKESYMGKEVYCDVCTRKLAFGELKHRLHYCPQTDICSNCIKQHFP
ncbi:unnamed protein product [Rotaria magnacalcarata]|uniref:RING-type domain-containing protein n=1 Tax=Rotaria magnacalcarata TaxID=392030 RepID=A0A815HVR0_9BILA|nr:unnamed protein product [Rotaria magnacalcarata]CAF5061279.1 unnamed protein product [Rotaria magnacalcarata]